MTKRILLTGCVLLLVVFVIIEIGDTYALFEKEANTTVENDLAQWVIKINSETMGLNVSEFPIENITWNNSSNVVSGKVAPGIGGYFDIVIDPTDTQVSVRYDITFDFTLITNDMFVVTDIFEVVDDGLVETAEDVYTGIISLEDINDEKIHIVRVSLDWLNDEDNNASDSLLGKVRNNRISIPIEVNVSQYLGEEIVGI